MQLFYKSQRGVTLMEMMAIVMIIGILSTIAIPNFVTLIKNHRLRQSSIVLLSALRKERSRALSLSRQIQVSINATDWTYIVKKLEFNFFDPMQLAAGEELKKGDEIFTEPEQTIASGSFKTGGLESVVINSSAAAKLDLTFNPSGTVNDTATITLSNNHLSYQIQVYKGGQMQLVRNY